MPKNDKSSKIVIQGKFELAVSFVANELPNVYKDVFELGVERRNNENNKIIIKSLEKEIKDMKKQVEKLCMHKS